MNRAALAILILLSCCISVDHAQSDVGFTAFTSDCKTDGEIPADRRAKIDQAAMNFINAVQTHPDAAYAMMTGQVHKETSSEKLSSQLKAYIEATGPYTNLKPAHDYLVITTGTGSDTKAVCGSVSGTDWVALQIKPGLTQAHVVLSGQTRNNDWAFTLWLLPEDGAWRVQYFHIGMSAMAGRSANDLIQLAQKERTAGHMFNAALLYAGAKELVDRGPAFQLGTAQTLDQDLKGFGAPPELQQSLPMTWKMGGSDYKVLGVNILGVAGQIGLSFDLPLTVWKSSEDADKQNHAFLDAFLATHPNYASAFKFLVARAHKPDGSGGFATVYEAGKGYD